MEMSALTKLLKGHLKEHKERAIEPNAGNLTQRDTYLINLETQLTFRELEAVIEKLEKFGGETEITADHVKIVTDFFAKRWERIKNTNAIYSIELASHGNLLCTEAAEFLAKHLKEAVNGKSHFALLMPTIKSWRSSRLGNNNIDMKYPHSFLPTHDNQYCIEIGFLKEFMRGKQLVISHKEGSVDRELSAEERNRLYAHTQTVKSYYEKLMKLLVHADSNEDEIQKAKLELRDALSKEDYAKHGIKSSYGLVGENLLHDNLMKSVNDLFTSREQLFDYMAMRSTPKNWDAFLSTVDTRVLNTLINNGVSLKKTVKSDSLYTGDETHNKAVLFALAETYLRERGAQGVYTSYSAYLFPVGYDKTTKENAVKAIKDFLVNCKLSGWNEFVQKQDKLLAGAIQDGTVGYISAQIKKIEENSSLANTQKSTTSILVARK